MSKPTNYNDLMRKIMSQLKEQDTMAKSNQALADKAQIRVSALQMAISTSPSRSAKDIIAEAKIFEKYLAS